MPSLSLADEPTSVRVALRIRPFVSKEENEGATVCVGKVKDEPQVILGKNRAFTYDYVFDQRALQSEIFQESVTPLLDGFFEGYNATILAYGQTGSGKTFTMGSGIDVNDMNSLAPDENKGIIPRAARYLFQQMRNRIDKANEQNIPEPQYILRCSFLELYNDDLIDLLDARGRDKDNLKLREDINGDVELVGAQEVQIESPGEMIAILNQGSLARTTGATDMNATSSRSHAIFTLMLIQKRSKELPSDDGEMTYIEERLTSKFHFVDLAGSERLKRTHAVGERAKEGININLGLMTLSRVISALGDEKQRATFVPYRDSKLTRLLQSSLGGNSRTLMIACVSPADTNYEETHSTLRYANTARNIQNKAVINKDPSAADLLLLRAEIASLREKLRLYESGGISEGTVSVGGDERVARLQEELFTSQRNNTILKQKLQEASEQAIAVEVDRAMQLIGAATPNQDEEDLGIDDSFDKESLRNLLRGYIQTISNQQQRIADLEATSVRDIDVPRSPFVFSPGPSPRRSDLPEAIFTIRAGVASPLLSRVLLLREEGKRGYMQRQEILSEEIFTQAWKIGHVDDLRTSLFAKINLKDEAYRMNRVEDNIVDDVDEDDDGQEQETSDNEAAGGGDERNGVQRKLERIEQSIKDKEALALQWEKAKKDLEEKINSLMREKALIRRELDSALVKMKTTKSAVDKATLDTLKERYEAQIRQLSEQIAEYQKKFLENEAMLRQKRHQEAKLLAMKTALEEAQRQKAEMIKRLREEQKNLKSLRTDTTREIKVLQKRDLQKSILISQLERKNDTLIRQLEMRTMEVSQLREKLRTRGTRVPSASSSHHASNANTNSTSFTSHSSIMSIKSFIPPLLTATTTNRPRSASNEEPMLKPLLKQGADIFEQVGADIALKKSMIDDDIQRCVFWKETESRLDHMYQQREQLAAARTHAQSILADPSDQHAQQEALNEIEDATVSIENITQRIQDLQMELAQSHKEIDDAHQSLATMTASATESDLRPLLLLTIRDVIAFRAASRQQHAEVSQLRKQNADLQSAMTTFKSRENEQKPEATVTAESDVMKQIRELEEQNERLAKLTLQIKNEQTLLLDQPHEPESSASTASISIEQTTPPQPALFSSASDENLPLLVTDISARPRALSYNDVFARLTQSSTSLSRDQVERHSEEGFSQGTPVHGTAAKAIDAVFVLRGHTGAVCDITVQDHHLFSASKDTTVKMWDMERRDQIGDSFLHTSFVRAVCVSGKTLMTASENLVRLWDVNTGRMIRAPLDGHTAVIGLLKLHPNGHLVYSCSTTDGVLHLWDLRMLGSKGTKSSALTPSVTLSSKAKTAVCALAFQPENGLIFAGSRDRNIRVYDDKSLELQATLMPTHFDEIRCITLAGHYLFSGGGNAAGFLKRWNVIDGTARGGRVQLPISINSAHKEGVQALLARPQDGSLLSGARDGIMKLWEPPSTINAAIVDASAEWKAHDGCINALALAGNDGKRILSAADDKTIKMWHIRR